MCRADDDVWFKFIATNSVQTITVDPSVSMDAVVELFSGACATLTSITCMDIGFTDDNEVINAVGLIPGNTYYIRVYDYYASTGGAPFQICIVGAATPTPSNDEPCNAIVLPQVTSSCNFLNFTTTGATTSTTSPTPSSCAGGSAPQQGGFNNSPQPKDVWFAITVHSSGIISITAQPSYGISDGVMALYSGICSSLTQIACSDDYNYPSSANDYKPFILASGLTPGATVYLRYWAFNGDTTGNFGICASTPENDNCGSSLYICDLNGYTGTTSAAYSVDRPCNMRGNAEMNDPPTYTYTPGTCQYGIFGLGGSWGTGAPNCDVRIDNNSWIRFTASNTTATLDVNIYNCFVGSYPSGGIQMQIFSSNGSCCNFTPVSDFKEGSSLLTITANNLTIGNDYYLMIDGFAGDICSYSITASAGVQFTNITTASSSICIGQTIVLHGPDGASSYLWSPGGQTSQDITVTPAYSQTYSLEVTGVCGDRQTLNILITVNNLPTASISPATSTICNGQSATLTASGGTSYIWSNGGNTASITVSPGSSTNYTVTVTNASGCTAVTSRTVTVNANPTASISPATSTICNGQSATLTASGGTSYIWSNGGNTASITVSPGSSTNYTVTVTNAFGCTATSTTTVTVNSLPVANAGVDQSIPNGTSTTLSGSASGGSGSYSYLWSPAGSLVSSTVQNPQTTNLTISTAYTVTVTDNNSGCTSTDQVIITVTGGSLSLNVTTNNSSICNGQSTQLNAIASGGTGSYTYIWSSNPAGFSSTLANPTVSPTVTTTYYVTINDGFNSSSSSVTVTVNQLPIVSITPASQSICNGQNATLTASGGTSYSWNNGSNTSSITVTPNTTTTYTVTVIDALTCSNTTTSTVTVMNTPSATSSNSGPYCSGNNIQLNSSGGSTYSWLGPNGWSSTLQNPSINNSNSSMNGTYSVTVTNAAGCTATSSTTVIVNTSPTVDAGNSISITYGTNTTLNGTATNGSGNYTFLWSPDTLLLNTNIQNPTTVNLFSNTTFYVTVTDVATGCSATDNVTVTVSGSPLIILPTASPNIICDGQSITLSANVTGGTGNYTYTWNSVPSGFNSSSATATDSPHVNTVYYVTVNDGFNNSTSRVSVTVYPTPVASASNTGAYCEGEQIQLNALGGTNYVWSGPLSYSSVSQNPQLVNSTIYMSGTYIVTVSNAYSCTSVANTTVTVNEKPVASISTNGPYCYGDTIKLFVNSASTYLWTGPNGFSSNLQNPEILNSSPSQSETYSVVITNSNGCSDSSQVDVSYPNAIVVSGASVIDQTEHLGNVDITVSGGISPYTYIWSNGYQTEDISDLISGNYIVTVTDSLQCYSVSNFKIDIPLIIPSVITPNNDGTNDNFEITNIGVYANIEVEIFDRWGDKIFIFKGTGIQYYDASNRWNGKYKGKDLPMGSYMYIVKLDDIKPVTGVVSIIR